MGGCPLTGGANGIGAAIVERLCKEGCHRVFVADIDVNSGGAELAQAPCIIHQRKANFVLPAAILSQLLIIF